MAEARREAALEVGRQRLAGRHREADRGERVVGQVGVEEGGDEAGAGEEQRRALVADQRGDLRRRRPTRVEHGAGPDRQRERQGVAEAVGEEQLGDRQAAVVRLDLQHGTGERLGRRLGAAVAVHHALRQAGRAGAVQPERRRVGDRSRPPEPRCGRRTSTRRGSGRTRRPPARRRRRRGAARRRRRRRRRRGRGSRWTAQRRWPACRRRSPPAPPAVNIVESGTGTTPGPERAEEPGREGELVVEHQRHPLATADVELAQRLLDPPHLAAAGRRSRCRPRRRGTPCARRRRSRCGGRRATPPRCTWASPLLSSPAVVIADTTIRRTAHLRSIVGPRRRGDRYGPPPAGDPRTNRWGLLNAKGAQRHCGDVPHPGARRTTRRGAGTRRSRRRPAGAGGRRTGRCEGGVSREEATRPQPVPRVGARSDGARLLGLGGLHGGARPAARRPAASPAAGRGGRALADRRRRGRAPGRARRRTTRPTSPSR